MFRSNYQIVGEDKEVLAEYGFFTPDPEEGIVSVLLSGASDIKQKQIIEVRYNHNTIRLFCYNIPIVSSTLRRSPWITGMI